MPYSRLATFAAALWCIPAMSGPSVEAAAQPRTTLSAPAAAPAPGGLHGLAVAPARKSAERAVAYAIGGTLLPIVAGLHLNRLEGPIGSLGGAGVAFGYLAGPSLGNFYGDDARRGLIGMGLRLGGGLLFATGVVLALDEAFGGDRHPAAGPIMIGSLVVIGGSAIWNVTTAPASVRAYNQRRGLSIAPIVADPARGAGLAVAWRW